jgi:Tol biopolymer transport system component
MSNPSTCRRPVFRRIVISAVLAAGVCNSHAAVKLLTGDANNHVYASDAYLQDVSADGDLVLFSTTPPAAFYPPAAGITKAGLYLRRVSTNKLTYVDDPSVPGAGSATMSDNGRYIAFVGTNRFIYWRDVKSNVTRLITPAADGASGRPIISADGRYVAYCSVARNIVSNSSKLQAAGRAGIYLYDSVNKTTAVVSLTQSGKALDTGVGSVAGAAAVTNEFDFSADGKYIVFTSDATNVHPDRPSTFPASFTCLYRRNLSTGAVNLLNKTSGGKVADGGFSAPRISANGSRVCFVGQYVGTFGGVKLIDSVPSQFGYDVYVKDAVTGALWWATKTTDNAAPDGTMGLDHAISGDGNTIAFSSSGTKFVKEFTDATTNDGSLDIFRVDLLSGGKASTTLVTKSPKNISNVDYVSGPFIPGDGSYVAFCTYQGNAMLGTGTGDSDSQGFSVSAPGSAAPEIVVQQPVGTNLTDGSAKNNFGSVALGSTGAAVTFTIKNTGKATLSGLAVSKTGTHKNDFIVSPLGKTSLTAGISTTFTIKFKPSAAGPRNAAIHIQSNDADENPFDVNLTGAGGVP